MKRKKRNWLIAIASVLLLGTVCLTLGLCISGSNAPKFTGFAAEYRNALIEKGFPEEYANELTELHLLHPTWEFVPLCITDVNSAYTWDYVIGKETENPETNLVTPQSDYAAYRHPTNFKTYDSGFYQASTKTVKYFMDPRNFLNEADIFQFYDLSSSTVTSADAINAVLDKTYMETAVLENGKTYTEYLLELEREIGIDSVYLAVKLRQEQGTAGTSPIISGTCGTLLLSYYKNQTQYTESGKKVNPPKTGETDAELLALNGHYNPFNLKATGDGVYAIYKNAMEYAVKGSPSMQADWGSPSWNKMWKGIYGGALQISERYINRYQSTVYLQKFNVDSRAGSNHNFISQYMQNIAGAFTEGRTMFQTFAANGMLDAPCQFLIPVYEGMPSAPCADPAGGNCTAYKSAALRYTAAASLTAPIEASEENEPIFSSVEIAYDKSLKLRGTFTHSYGMRGLEYSWDGQAWTSCSQSGALELSLPCNELTYGEHILLIRGESAYDHDVSGRKQNRYFLGAVISVTVLPPPSANITFQTNGQTATEKHYEGTTLRLPSSNATGFAGWLTPNGAFLPAGAEIDVSGDAVYTAIIVQMQTVEGASVLLDNHTNLRFYATVSESDLQAARRLLPNDSFRIMARLTCNNTVSPAVPVRIWEETALFPDKALHRKLTVDTPTITDSEKDSRWSADFFLEINYSNGATGTVKAAGTSLSRSAVQVAYEALADDRATLNEQARLALQQIVT